MRPPILFRGVPLQQRAAVVEARMQRLASTTSLITPQIGRSGRQRCTRRSMCRQHGCMAIYTPATCWWSTE